MNKRYRDFPYTPCPNTCIASPISSLCKQKINMIVLEIAPRMPKMKESYISPSPKSGQQHQTKKWDDLTQVTLISCLPNSQGPSLTVVLPFLTDGSQDCPWVSTAQVPGGKKNMAEIYGRSYGPSLEVKHILFFIPSARTQSVTGSGLLAEKAKKCRRALYLRKDKQECDE